MQSETLSVQIKDLPEASEAFSWAWQAMKDNNWEQAAKRWAVLRQMYPDYGPVWVQAAIAHRHLQEFDESASLLKEAVKKFPDNPNALVQQGELNITQERWESAEEIFKNLQVNFSSEIAGWVRYGDVLIAQGKDKEAEKANKEARERFPDRPWPHEQYAELAMKRARWQEALERWSAFRETFYNHNAGYYRAAVAAEQLGERNQARRLRMGKEYGPAWLKKIENDGNEINYINPPQRRSLSTFFELVWTKSRLNLKSEANRNHLRYVWWILDPIMYMSVFYVVFGLLMNRGEEGYLAYLLTGLVPFQWFAKTVQYTSGSILQGRGLMNQVKISPLFFPLVGVLQNAGKQALVFLILILFLIFYGVSPKLSWLAFIPVIVAQLFFMCVLCSSIALIVPFARDLLNLVPTGIQFMLFVSGIFYNTEQIPEKWQGLFFLNPMAAILHQYRLIFIESQWPDWSSLGWLIVGCLIAVGIIALIYRKFEAIYPRVVIE